MHINVRDVKVECSNFRYVLHYAYLIMAKYQWADGSERLAKIPTRLIEKFVEYPKYYLNNKKF